MPRLTITGVQLVACSTPANAKALLKSAIRSDNPIVFFEVRFVVKTRSFYARTILMAFPRAARSAIQRQGRHI